MGITVLFPYSTQRIEFNINCMEYKEFSFYSLSQLISLSAIGLTSTVSQHTYQNTRSTLAHAGSPTLLHYVCWLARTEGHYNTIRLPEGRKSTDLAKSINIVNLVYREISIVGSVVTKRTTSSQLVKG